MLIYFIYETWNRIILCLTFLFFFFYLFFLFFLFFFLAFSSFFFLLPLLLTSSSLLRCHYLITPAEKNSLILRISFLCSQAAFSCQLKILHHYGVVIAVVEMAATLRMSMENHEFALILPESTYGLNEPWSETCKYME